MTLAKVVVQIEKDGPLEFVDVDLPAPAPHQVLVRVLATGLCQSQIFWMHAERKAPVLFGHEGYGVAAAVGSAVTGIREGDAVLVTWVPRKDPSGRTPEVSTVTLDGGVVARAPNVYTWADHCIADELYVRPIQGRGHDALMSVIGCAVITGAGSVMNAARLQKDESVAVFGVGGVGLSAVSAARVMGVRQIVAVDVADEKLEFARHFGATDVVNSLQQDPVDTIMRLAPARCGCHPGVDVAVDCVAHPKVTRQALGSLRAGRLGIERGGRCVLVGIPKLPVEVDAMSLLMQEKSLIGALGGSAAQDKLDDYIEWYRDGLLDLEAMVTDRYRFDQIPAGADALARGLVKGRAIALIPD